MNKPKNKPPAPKVLDLPPGTSKADRLRLGKEANALERRQSRAEGRGLASVRFPRLNLTSR